MINQGGRRSAPERGSFPLDHFRLCEEQALRFNDCMAGHGMMPKKCQRFQKNYLQCRMKAGLMKPEPLENLGFTEANSYPAELQRKAELYKLAVAVDKRATNNVRRMKGLAHWDNNIYHVCSLIHLISFHLSRLSGSLQPPPPLLPPALAPPPIALRSSRALSTFCTSGDT